MTVKELCGTVKELRDCGGQVTVGLRLSGSCGTVGIRELWDCDCQGATRLSGDVCL